MNDRFRYRIPVYKNNEFDGYIYICLGDKIPDLYGGRYGMAEQCTGLKDKNGTLIYEGDIVEFDGDFRGDIAWDEDAGCWAIRTTENTIYTFDNFYGYELEIVGNIHKNPELLEQ